MIVSEEKIYNDTVELAKEIFRSGKQEGSIEFVIREIFQALKKINKMEGE